MEITQTRYPCHAHELIEPQRGLFILDDYVEDKRYSTAQVCDHQRRTPAGLSFGMGSKQARAGEGAGLHVLLTHHSLEADS
jgi:hypothetical protein